MTYLRGTKNGQLRKNNLAILKEVEEKLRQRYAKIGKLQESDRRVLVCSQVVGKEHNGRSWVTSISLNFDEEERANEIPPIVRGKEEGDAYLKKPFKETLKTPLTLRIIEFVRVEYKMSTNIKLYNGTTDPKDYLSHFALADNSGEWPTSVWCRMFQQTLDGTTRGWFECLPSRIINEWTKLQEQFTTRFSTRRACFKDPIEITQIIRKANETVIAFKEQ
ncbi:hypothetical protein Tco_1354726 [Tanacetum coccineum]